MTSVLYDTPGPKAKVRNHLYSVLFVVVLGLVLWWVLAAMAEKGQLEWRNWEPYLTDSESWETYLLPGLMNTIKAAVISILIALPIGAIFGIARLSDNWWIRWPAGVVVEFFRAVPVLILMLSANVAYAQFANFPPDTRLLYAVVTGLVLYNGSVLAEVVRAGILSIPRGQTEAAMAVGMRKGQLMTNVLLPQAVTAMLPAIVSQLVVIVKDTAIGGAVLGFGELINSVRPASAFYFNVIATLIVITAMYIALNFVLTSFASWLEKWLRTRKRGGTAVVAGDWIEEQAPGLHFEEGERRR